MNPDTVSTYPSVEEAVAAFVMRELDYWSGKDAL